MLRARFEEITPADVMRLIELKTAERKTLEYKERLPSGNREERVEFLSDVSSFANASGGEILFGISDERDEAGRPTGIPAEIKPLQVDNAATKCAQIEQIIESGIQPRLPLVQVKSLDIPERGSVILIRIGKSWIGPHMVTFSNLSRFFSRNSSTGKVQLDVQQIGAAFALQRGLGERLRDWKTDRIAKAIAEEGPIPLPGSKLLLHFIPASILISDEPVYPRRFDPQSWGQGANLMTFGSDIRRYNADGFLLASGSYPNGKRSYLQVFRQGALEYGDEYALDNYGNTSVPSRVFEEKLAGTFQSAQVLLKHLEVPEPIFVTLSLIGMKGRTMALPQPGSHFSYASEPFDRDLILCPDVLLDNTVAGASNPSALLPLVNSIWQAAGLEKTPFIDKQRRWLLG